MSRAGKLPEGLPIYYGRGREPLWSQFNRSQNDKRVGWVKPIEWKKDQSIAERFGWKVEKRPYKFKKKMVQPKTKFSKGLSQKRILYKPLVKKKERYYTYGKPRTKSGLDLAKEAEELEELRALDINTKLQQSRINFERNMFIKKYSK